MDPTDTTKQILSQPIDLSSTNGDGGTIKNSKEIKQDVPTEPVSSDLTTDGPAIQATIATPETEVERSEQETVDASAKNESKDDFESITSQPGRREPMEFAPASDTESDFQPRSSYTLSEAGSGYDKEQNECADFCLDLFSCFGLLEACCPTDGDGCVTTFAVCLGNVIFGCCRCK